MKKFKTNPNYTMVISPEKTDDMLLMKDIRNTTLDEYVVVKDNGPRFATRYTYTTMAARKRNEYFDCGTAFGALQQAMMPYLKSANLSWTSIYVKFIKE